MWKYGYEQGRGGMEDGGREEGIVEVLLRSHI
jgi:hypothetical protein